MLSESRDACTAPELVRGAPATLHPTWGLRSPTPHAVPFPFLLVLVLGKA